MSFMLELVGTWLLTPSFKLTKHPWLRLAAALVVAGVGLLLGSLLIWLGLQPGSYRLLWLLWGLVLVGVFLFHIIRVVDRFLHRHSSD
ncbi:hypothetical protein [Lacticaseibacillus suibinensis]|uniref:hypothetical protein n=1 Tax=Lacticaseibacillus suibinensis TaxID=2486011 RepID=UPI000F7A9BC9|nr:hypothetical protein [Lacticaseibacillus suibinensis]